MKQLNHIKHYFKQLKRSRSVYKATLPKVNARINIDVKQVRRAQSLSSRNSIAALIVLVLVFSAVTIFRLVNLQFGQGVFYKSRATQNQTRQTFVYAPRGVIRDAQGHTLVNNKIVSQASLVPYLWQANQKNCLDISDNLAKLAKTKTSKIIKLVSQHKNSYDPELLARSLNRSESIILSQLKSQCPAIVVSQVPSRNYVNNLGLAQILGYIGQPNDDDLNNINNLLPTDYVGKTGLEKYYDNYLRGQDGVTRVQVDALGNPKQTLSEVSAKTGQNIKLNIDIDLQKALVDSLASAVKKANSPRGAAVALNPKTGQILALVSLPEYNNNDFANGISQKDYQKLLNNPQHPLVDTAVSGGFPSGSVIKPIVASAALQEGVVTPQTIIVDRGYIEVPNVYNPNISYRYNGWDLSGLGPVDAVQAIALSSDIYFYTIGGGYGNQAGLGVKRLTNYYKIFGLGSPTGIDLPFDSTGRVPTPAFKKAYYNQPWTVGDTYNISIGQGDLTVSPLQMALAEAAVINNGYLMQPQIVQSIGDKLLKPKIKSEVPIDKKYLEVARQGMEAVIKTFNPSVFAGINAQIAGKTGTAETAENEQPDAWFVGYGPTKNSKIVIAVFVKNGGAGSDVAAPVAAAGLKNYLNNH